MQASKLALLSLVALSPLLLLRVSAADPLFKTCSYAGNYSSPSTYADNLQTLVTALVSKAEATGFASAVAGAGDATAYGIALCRGDVPRSTCRACVADAANELRHRACPVQKEATIWYYKCMVRYAARDIIGTMEYGFSFTEPGTEVVPDPAAFDAKVVGLLKRVSSEASGNEKKLFATEVADVVVGGKKEKLYSLAQCTRDIKPEECKKCLQVIIGEFPFYLSGKKGGSTFTESCNFRYELYRFYD